MPTFPEVAHTGGFVGGIEILGKPEAKQQGHSYGNVGVAREIHVDLKGISKEGRKILKTGKSNGIGKDPVHKIEGDIIAYKHLLKQTFQDHEKGKSKLLHGEAVALIELWDKLRGSDNGTCYQLREKAYIEAEVENVPDRVHLPPVYIHRIRDGLEGIEGDPNGKQDGTYLKVRTRKVVGQ